LIKTERFDRYMTSLELLVTQKDLDKVILKIFFGTFGLKYPCFFILCISTYFY